MSGHLETLYMLCFSAVLAAAATLDHNLDNESFVQLSYALGFGGIGASLGALSASMATNVPPKEMRKRFQIHFLIGIPTGIGAGYSLGYYFAEVPTWACILAASSVCGWLGVKTILFAESKLKNKR